MTGKRDSRLAKRAELLLAGKKQRQQTISVKVHGRAAEIWVDLTNAGAQASLTASEILALLLQDSGVKLAVVLEGIGNRVQAGK